jgi:hypothetical protein
MTSPSLVFASRRRSPASIVASLRLLLPEDNTLALKRKSPGAAGVGGFGASEFTDWFDLYVWQYDNQQCIKEVSP